MTVNLENLPVQRAAELDVQPPEQSWLIQDLWGLATVGIIISIPAVVLIGIHLSGSQLHLLRRTPRSVLMLDGDHAGRSDSRQITGTLNRYTRASVHRVDLPQGLDPDDLDDLELSCRLLPLLPLYSSQTCQGTLLASSATTPSHGHRKQIDPAPGRSSFLFNWSFPISIGGALGTEQGI